MKKLVLLLILQVTIGACSKIRELRMKPGHKEVVGETITASDSVRVDADLQPEVPCDLESPPLVIFDKRTSSFQFCDKGAWRLVPAEALRTSGSAYLASTVDGASYSVNGHGQAVSAAGADSAAGSEVLYRCNRGKSADYVCQPIK